MKKKKLRNIILIVLVVCVLSIWVSRTFVHKALGGGYCYDKQWDYAYIHRDSPIFKSIPGIVYAYSYSSDYILAIQLSYDFSKQPGMKDLSQRAKNKIIKKDGLPNFWIINRKQDSILGPMTLDQYLQERKVLKIPENLQLVIQLER